MQYGRKIAGALKPRFVVSAGENNDLSVPGEIYQFDIETEGFSAAQEEQIIAQLLTLEAQTPDLKILHINADAKSNVITMQFTDTGPNAFSFIGLMGAMPIIFGLLLIGVLAYTLWTVYSSNPYLLWAILVLGGGVAFFYLTYGHLPTPSKEIYSKTPDALGQGQKTERERHDHRMEELKAEAEYRRQQTELEARNKQADKDKEKAKKSEKEAKKQEDKAEKAKEKLQTVTARD